MAAKENADLMLQVFHAIERRDLPRLLTLIDAAADFHWPRSLPYGGSGPLQPAVGPSWAGTWIPLQPTETEQRMDARVVAATEDEVVVLWHQRGVSLSGERCDVPVLALYEIRDGKLARAQMFYFDSTEVSGFLSRAAA